MQRSGIILALYQYRYPWDFSRTNLVRVTSTDSDGNFDFGDLKSGHYTVAIDWPQHHADYFDVEITKLPKQTDKVIIDITMVNPDCTGGHEFISE